MSDSSFASPTPVGGSNPQGDGEGEQERRDAPVGSDSAPRADASPYAPPSSSPTSPTVPIPYAPTQGSTAADGSHHAGSAQAAVTAPMPTAPAGTPSTADAHSSASVTAGERSGSVVTSQAAPETQWQLPPADLPPAAPKAPVGRVRKRAVAAICVGALALGLVGGAGGAWAYNEWGPNSSSVALPVSDGASVERPEGSVASIAAAVMPSVVSIESVGEGERTSTGTGFVIREDGYILTNNHVVAGAVDGKVKVLKSDGSIEEAEVIGTTPEYDIAVIKVDETGLAPLVLGNSDEVVVGDPAIAVGSPLGLDSTVTTGIISALHRPVTAGGGDEEPAYIDAIQTDAAINPGNSGGPLINSAGEVIGINSAIATLGGSSTQQAGSVGLGFAITSNQARRTAEQLINDGEADFPVIGVLLDQRYTGEGIKVVDDETGIIAGGPSDDAGLEPGDVITQIDGRPVTRSDELVVAIRAKAPGDDVELTVMRDGQEQTVTVTLGSSNEVNLDESAPSPTQ